jgi:hypothetical protein
VRSVDDHVDGDGAPDHGRRPERLSAEPKTSARRRRGCEKGVEPLGPRLAGCAEERAVGDRPARRTRPSKSAATANPQQ